jgi:hypothetical protein
VVAALLLLAGRGPAVADAQETEDLPSPGSAFLFSLTTTAAPVAGGAMLGGEAGLVLIGAGLLFGPVSGYAYGDAMDRGGRGLAFRAIAAGGMVGGIFVMCQFGECNPFRDNIDEDRDLATGALLVGLVGTIVIGGSALIDVLSVPDHVSRRNASRRVDLFIAPLVSPSGGAGLVARLRF